MTQVLILAALVSMDVKRSLSFFLEHTFERKYSAVVHMKELRTQQQQTLEPLQRRVKAATRVQILGHCNKLAAR